MFGLQFLHYSIADYNCPKLYETIMKEVDSIVPYPAVLSGAFAYDHQDLIVVSPEAIAVSMIS